MRNITYFLLLLCSIGFSQSPLVVASKQQAGGSPTYGSEQYTEGNCIATGGSEANGTTGLTNNGLTTFESISSSPAPQDGSYLFHMNTTSQPDRMEEVTALTTGTIYKIEYWAWSTVTLSGRSNLWVGFEASADGGGAWEATPSFYYTLTPTKYTHILKTTASAQTLRFYVTNDTAEVYIDGLSIKEVL